MSANSVGRFSGRVENYIKYRPGYPEAALDLLGRECGLGPRSDVADVGSGTGILSEMLLRRGCRVHGVEPNREMREACERLLSSYENFVSVDGRAEATTLGDRSVDFVTAGQAFHWFDPAGARREFGRILRPGGWVVVMWNERRTEGTPFSEEYERLLLDFGTDYREVSHKYAEETLIAPFFGERPATKRTFDNKQVFDFDSLKGRLLSASYTPEPGHPSFLPMLAELERIFARRNQGGRVTVEYDTKLFYGRLSA